MLRNIWLVALREFRRILGDRRLLAVMLGFPLLGATLLNVLYMERVVNHIPTAVYDRSGTGLSRAVVQAFADSERFDIVAAVNSEEEMRRAIESRKVQAAVVIPEDFARDIKRGRGSKVLVVVNGTNFLYSNAVLSSAGEIVGALSAGTAVTMLEGHGYLPGEAAGVAGPVQLATRVWYNPTFNYPNFLVLGLVATIIQQVLLLYVSVTIAREKEEGTLRELLDKNYSAAQVVAGKVIPYFLLNFASLNVILAECCYVFKIPFNGSVANLLSMEVLFLGGITALGIFLSAACSKEIQATQLAMLFALPSFLFSGYTWPLDSMPAAARAIAAVMPLTYFVTNLRDIALMDIQLPVMMKDIVVLGLLNIVLLPAAVLVFRRQYYGYRDAGAAKARGTGTVSG